MFYLQEGFTYLFSIADEIKRLDGLKKRDRSATPNLQDYVPG